MSKYSEKKKRRLENAERERNAVEQPVLPRGGQTEDSPAPSGGASARPPSPPPAATPSYRSAPPPPTAPPADPPPPPSWRPAPPASLASTAEAPSPQRTAPPPAQGGPRAYMSPGRPVAPWHRGHGEPPGDRVGGAAVKRAVQSSRTTAAGIGGFGPCGRPICCAGWLKNAEELKVSIRMAKAQTVSLSPESINGYCCQMKCCLSFEYGQEGCAVCPVVKKKRAAPVSATPPAAGPAQTPAKPPEGDER